PHAVKVTHETMEAHGVNAELILTNIASGLEKRLAGLVDVMVVNPPYVPTPEDEVGHTLVGKRMVVYGNSPSK
ncbi:hemK methyltransferase family member 2-like, partial [Trifolium medium]|nr:hemK methyltransferase family member 2-like [Trifolium medium]